MSGITIFNDAIAQKYGTDVAIFLDKMSFWIGKNLANKKNIHDGKCWTYNSQEALLILFPYWTRQNLRSVIKKCTSIGLIEVGNYNKKKYDKTAWYSLTMKGLSLFPTLESLTTRMGTDWLESTNALVRINQAIPSTTTDTKKDICMVDSIDPGNQPTITDKKKTPVSRDKPTDAFLFSLVAIYHETFPDNPKHNLRVLSKSLRKVLTETVRNWSKLNPDGKELTPDGFRKFLLYAKATAPGWTLTSYAIKSESTERRFRKNNLENIARFENIIKLGEGRYT